MSREAIATSVMPSRSALMPLPDPVPEIVTVMFGLAFMKPSAVSCIAGRTVVEPLTVTVSA